jgi:serine/threonine protein kinase
VNLAIDREDGSVFAVKSVVVNESSEVAVRAIENEIDILQRLDSKYVVRCLGSDWTSEGGQVMRNALLEYMPEGCLIDFVRQFASSGVLDERLLRTYTRSIVEGIEYLHSEGIVHCDIKGKNILVGNGSVKLTDFGSSKRVGDAIDSDVVNCAAKVNGTPLWMAPEVVRQVEQGPASDIWSLGCTVVEMATGRAPWSNFANHFAALYHIGCTDELPQVPASLSD